MVTLLPSICSTLVWLSPLRVSSAVLPSFRNATALGSEALLPVSTLPASVSRLSLTVNTETVPSARLAISASVPSGDTRTCVAPSPAAIDCTTFGGDDLRSITETRLSGEMPSVPAASALVAEVTMAQLSSGATQTAAGGPTTLCGASMVAPSFGGYCDTSMIVMVSGFGD